MNEKINERMNERRKGEKDEREEGKNNKETIKQGGCYQQKRTDGWIMDKTNEMDSII